MKALIDLNVCLNVMLDRRPFVAESGPVFELAEKYDDVFFISATGIDTLFYILRPEIGSSKATEYLKLLTSKISVGTVNDEVIQQALQSEWNDLEDTIHYYCAVHNECNYLITRNVDDFFPEKDKTKVITPAKFPSVFNENGA